MMSSLFRHWRLTSGLFALIAASVILGLHFLLPAGASEEYIYTVKCLLRYVLSPLLLWLIYLFLTLPFFRKGKSLRIAVIALLLGSCCICIPFMAPGPLDQLSWHIAMALSACWALGLLLLSSGFFLLGASGSALRVALFCTLGSVCIALSFGEAFLLFTPQWFDGLHYANATSRHLANRQVSLADDKWEDGVCGLRAIPTGKPLAVAKRYLRYDDEIYDVVYEFDAKGKRPTPAAASQPEYGLLLFGCSYTYGHGLDTIDGWPWKLAKLLGPEWQVENYGGNGYSANQMLCFLEHELVEKPRGLRRYALFLAIEDHLRRNEFFSHYPHYALAANGQPQREGKSRYCWVNRLPDMFQGSQLAHQAAVMATGAIMGVLKPEQQKLYLTMLQRSAEILKQKYDAELIVLLWPDFEHLAPELQKLGIRFALAKAMLPAWGEAGDAYKINPQYEVHPNAKAGDDLATGLAAYLEKLVAGSK